MSRWKRWHVLRFDAPARIMFRGRLAPIAGIVGLLVATTNVAAAPRTGADLSSRAPVTHPLRSFSPVATHELAHPVTTTPKAQTAPHAGSSSQPASSQPGVMPESVDGHRVVATAPWKKPIVAFEHPSPPALGASSVRVHQALGVPKTATVSKSAVTVARRGFVSIYDPEKKQPLLVSWKVTRSDIDGDKLPRLEFFGADPHLGGLAQPKVQDYMKAFPSYDAGHMVPQSDRPRRANDETANAATYTPSNLVLQASNNNQGPWLHLEQATQREIKNEQRDAYVQAGAIFAHGGPTLNGLPIASHTYKIVVTVPEGTELASLKPSDPRLRVTAVLIPNNNHDVAKNDSYAKYAVSPGRLVELTGFQDLLSGLPSDVRAATLAHQPHLEVKENGQALLDGRPVKKPR